MHPPLSRNQTQTSQGLGQLGPQSMGRVAELQGCGTSGARRHHPLPHCRMTLQSQVLMQEQLMGMPEPEEQGQGLMELLRQRVWHPCQEQQRLQLPLRGAPEQAPLSA